MLSVRSLWSRHRRKVFLAVGALGGAYVLYKFYDTNRKRVAEVERQFEGAQEIDELIKSQLQNHFENIQRISDSTTLPHAMHCLRCRISEDLDLSYLTEKLRQAKGQSTAPTPHEKAELWERLKVLSFTRLTASVWSMMMLCLYVRVQVNILGRHLYVDIARDTECSQTLEEYESFSWHAQKDFLATADYLSTYGFSALIMNLQRAAAEVLKDKQLKNPFSVEKLREVILQILELLLRTETPNYWISFLVPENATSYWQMTFPSSSAEGSSALMDVSKLEQLVSETREVLSSHEFKHVMELSLHKLVDVVVEEISKQLKMSNLSPGGVPLVTLLPRVTQAAPPLLEEPSNNRFIQILQTLPEVEQFYTLLYSNTLPFPSLVEK
ncbi:hypothetical protein HPP92_007875 [Vanilla planifolia]|uniref:Peroxin-3 n=1 Tax=Vanilla planifolia TaxID=51239 RepID=A0A835RS95_VANPL|nr:hypothetical protein HPP92_007875 [Vanilla planifolia]